MPIHPLRFCVILLASTFVSVAIATDDYADPMLTKKEREHWAFVVPKRAPIPTVKKAAAVKNPIDAFILAKLEKSGLHFAPEADKLSLIRRLSFDLIGLPPTPTEIDAFLADQSAQAYEKLVDRLLTSPHYGERWAQHWLDVVRFAESNGYELDAERPHAWQYRDYVIRSMNADKPYDRFLTEQIAGDILAKDKTPRDVSDLWHATGLHRCGQVHVVSGNVDADENRQEVLLEMVNGLSSAVMGVTLGCARCHDHKFDPLSQGDYYRMQAVFAGTVFKDVDLAKSKEKETHKKKTAEIVAKLAPIQKQIKAIEDPYRKKLTDERIAKLDEPTREAYATDAKKRTPEQKKLVEIAKPTVMLLWDDVTNAFSDEDRAKRNKLKDEEFAIEETRPHPLLQAWAIADNKSIPATHLLKRGDPKRKVGIVTPAVPRVMTTVTTPIKDRLDLTKWLTNVDHPLTARVIVNRLWQHHFVRGIVNTPNDFGTRGDAPTHPELLDWLACELMQPSLGAEVMPWSMKRIHRLMVCSETYRQASQVQPSADALKADPENKLLWRMNRRRLEAETIRDAVLTSSGSLTKDIGGRSVKVPLEPEIYDLIFTEAEPIGLWPVTTDVKQHTRRSLYLFMKRNVRQPLLEAFDQPDTLNSCSGRSNSTFAPQALILMNGPFSHDQSKQFASDLIRTVGIDQAKQIEQLYRRALGRMPTDVETQECRKFLSQKSPQALADLCLVVFNLNEFITIP